MQVKGTASPPDYFGGQSPPLRLLQLYIFDAEIWIIKVFRRHKQEKSRIYGIYSDVAESKLQIYKSYLTIQKYISKRYVGASRNIKAKG